MAAVPASIRYKNPGAMWGGNVYSRRWGEIGNVSLKDGTGQGNKIAVFPTYVAGICAQLDLWRSSKNYKNKMFKDAIRVWSGGNHVESYIKFVLDRVPGMTRTTVMNDTFWRGPMGIAFLKAQAWHEAGKKYPAPDADWIEARRIVMGETAPFAVSPPVSPPVEDDEDTDLNIQPVTTAPKIDVETIQRKLDQLGYHEVGGIDGIWGGKTAAAIAAYKNDRGLSGEPVIDKALTASIDKSIADGWSRPVSEERAKVTAQQIAPAVPAVRQTLMQRFWAKIAGFGAGIGALFSGASDYFDTVREKVEPFTSFFRDVPGWVWLAGIGGIAFLLVLSANKATDSIVDAKRTGRLN